MDPISHAALGRTLAALDTRRRLGAGAGTACLLGALCPDIDLARTLQGWDVYLVHHQAGTHSIAGAIGCGLLTGTVVRAFARRGRWLALCAAGSAGALSHLFLDLVSGADLKLFAPLWNHVFSMPLFAMADPWLLTVLVAGAIVVSLPRRDPARAPALNAVQSGSTRAHRTMTDARYALLVLAVVIGLKSAFLFRAQAIERRATAAGEATHAEAIFGSWRRWQFIEVHPATLDVWTADAIAGTAVRTSTAARELDAPFVRRSRALPTVANLLASHDDTFARVIRNSGGGHDVRWSALRYCSAGSAGSDPVCGLWFGGEYNARGRATAAVMRVGSLVQRRGPGVSSDHE